MRQLFRKQNVLRGVCGAECVTTPCRNWLNLLFVNAVVFGAILEISFVIGICFNLSNITNIKQLATQTPISYLNLSFRPHAFLNTKS